MPLKTGEYTWVNAIWIERPDAPIIKMEAPANWTLDRTYDRAIRELQRPAPGTVVFATLIGRLDAREKLQVSTKDSFPPVTYGYGHVGAFPARLLPVTVKDLVRENSKD